MCSYNITLDDTLVKKVRSSLGGEQALTMWLQQQMEEFLLNNHAAQETTNCTKTDEQTTPDIVLSLLGAGMPLEDDDINGRKAIYQ